MNFRIIVLFCKIYDRIFIEHALDIFIYVRGTHIFTGSNFPIQDLASLSVHLCPLAGLDRWHLPTSCYVIPGIL